MRKELGRFARKYMIGAYRIYEKIFWKIKGKQKNKGLHKLGYEYIKKMNEVLDTTGIKYFITYGTLLGIIREGKFIEHDDDIDFGVICDENFSWDKIENAMKKIGMKKKHQFRLEGEVTEQTYVINKLSVDFFLFYPYDGKNQLTYSYFRKANRIYEEGKFEVSKEIVPQITNVRKFENENGIFSIPENAEEFLEKEYGENWKTPDPNWKEKMNVMEGKIGYLEN